MLKDGEKGVILQRDQTSYAIAPHLPCGIVDASTLRQLADTAEKYNCRAIKVTSAARIALIGLQADDVDKAWQDLGRQPGHAVGLCIRSVKACPGTQFCRLGKQDSLAVGLELDRRYHGRPLPSKTKIGVSGCMNQCAENCIKDIGLVGQKKGWQLTAGGNGGPKPRLAQLLAVELETDKALESIEAVLSFYAANAKRFERLGKMIDRIGLGSVQAALPR